MAIVLALLSCAALRHPLAAARPRLVRRAAAPIAIQSSPPEPPIEKPNLPPSTEEGGPLSWLLPAQLLYESQAADRSKDLMVGEDAGVYAWKNEKWGEVFGLDLAAGRLCRKKPQ